MDNLINEHGTSIVKSEWDNGFIESDKLYSWSKNDMIKDNNYFNTTNWIKDDENQISFKDYEDPLKIRTKSWLSVIKKRATEEGKIEDSETKEALKKISETQEETINYQKHMIELIQNNHTESLDEIDLLKHELLKKSDLLESERRIRLDIEKSSKEIQTQLTDQITGLQAKLTDFLPYKIMLRNSLYVMSFFGFSLISDIFFNVKIIQPLWTYIGLSLASAFLIMSYFGYLEWEKRAEKR